MSLEMKNDREYNIENITFSLRACLHLFAYHRAKKLNVEKLDFSTISDEKLDSIAQSMTIFEELYNELDYFFCEEVPMKD